MDNTTVDFCLSFLVMFDTEQLPLGGSNCIVGLDFKVNAFINRAELMGHKLL